MNYIKRGESILIAFKGRESICDSQNKPRMYKNRNGILPLEFPAFPPTIHKDHSASYGPSAFLSTCCQISRDTLPFLFSFWHLPTLRMLHVVCLYGCLQTRRMLDIDNNIRSRILCRILQNSIYIPQGRHRDYTQLDAN